MGQNGITMRFRGRFDVKLDDRGRIKVPAKYLNIFEKSYRDEIYLTSLNGDHVLLYPLSEWENIEQKLEKVKMNPVIQEYISRTSYWGTEAEVDPKGRILMPLSLRNSAKLDENIFILGARDHLQVWNENVYNEQYLKGEWNVEKQAEISRIINGIPSLSSDE